MTLNGESGRETPAPSQTLVAVIAAATLEFGGVRYHPGLGNPEGWTSAGAFFADVAALEEFLVFEASFNPGTDLKAAAAFMLSDYLVSFTGLVVALFMQARAVPDLDPARVFLQFRVEPHNHGVRHYQFRRAWFSLPEDEGKVVTPAEPEALGKQIELHLRPLVDQLSRLSGLGRSSFWRLVADAFAGRFLEFGRAINREEGACQLALEVIRQPGSALNNRQVGYFDLTVPDRSGRPFRYRFRARGGCCRYYSVEGGKLFKTCVLSRKGRDAALSRLPIHRRL